MTNSRVQGAHRHSFWNEIYETVLAPYIFLATLLALVNPRLGSFNVTAKGGVVPRTFFDSRIAAPYLLMLGLNVLGILAAIPRYFQFPVVDAAFPLNLLALPLNLLARMHDSDHLGTIVVNVLWTLFNVVILGAAIAVAREQQQRRQTVRVDLEIPGRVTLPSGAVTSGSTLNMSTGGLMMRLARDLRAQPGHSLNVTFPVLDGEATLPAIVVQCIVTMLRAQFDPLQIHQEEALAMLLYSRADSWLGWGEAREADQPLRSLARIFLISMGGLKITAELVVARSISSLRPQRKRQLITSIAPLLLLLLAGALLPLQNDLKSLPLPFYASAVNLHPTIPIVFLTQPSPKAMQAAGMVASWFGILTDYRPARFPVSFGAIPQGNVIVLSENSAELPASFNMNGSSGATVAIRSNPNDPYPKCCCSPATIRTTWSPPPWPSPCSAASSRATRSASPASSRPHPASPTTPRAGSAPIASSTSATSPRPATSRATAPPHSAPTCACRQTSSTATSRTSRSTWATATTASPSRTTAPSSSTYMNDAYVSSTPMPHTDKASAKLETVVPIPVANMRPFSNSLMMQFIFLLTKKGRCQETAPYNLKGAVMKDSFLDIRDIPHWAVLPNLEIFANAGYPSPARPTSPIPPSSSPTPPPPTKSKCTSPSWATSAPKPATPSSTSPSPTTTA